MHRPTHPPTGLSPSTAPVPQAVRPGQSGALDPLETNGQPTDEPLERIDSEALASPIAFRHSGWATARARVRAALERVGVRQARLDAWDSCGGHPWIVRSLSHPELYQVHASCCHDRFCKPCASTRSRTVAANLLDRMARRKHRLITLTVRSAQEPLANLVDLLYTSFATLRRTTLWRTRVRGGAAFLEIKYNVHLDRWHPHLHIIAESQFIYDNELSDLWHRITGTSYIVDIRPIRDHDQAAGYVAKYASKPLSNSYLNDHDRLCEAVVALTGRRLCLTFGTWRKWALTKTPDNGPWHYLAPLARVVDDAMHGSKHDLDLLHHVGLTVDVIRVPLPPVERAPPAESYLFD